MVGYSDGKVWYGIGTCWYSFLEHDVTTALFFCNGFVESGRVWFGDGKVVWGLVTVPLSKEP